MQNITAVFWMVAFLACFFYEENQKYVANNIYIYLSIVMMFLHFIRTVLFVFLARSVYSHNIYFDYISITIKINKWVFEKDILLSSSHFPLFTSVHF